MATDATQRRRCPINVFDYLDYRHFLAEFYQAKKSRGFSYRSFSRSAGLGAPNYLKLVTEGKRNLTPVMATRFASACGLQGDAALFFERLVEFNQATSAQERQECYAKLASFKRYRQAQKLELAQAAYHSEWYFPAIRELCACSDFVPEPEWIARRLLPPITPHQARRALDVLMQLGLLERAVGTDMKPSLKQTAGVVSTGPQTSGLHIRSYHAEMMRRATAAMELVPAPQRDISSVTLCVDARNLPQLKERIQAFRRELFEFEKQAKRDCVVQINFQLFPLSVVKDGRARTGEACDA